jgi:hypothetical protein
MESDEDEMSCGDYASSMKSGLDTAILEGELASALALINPDSPVFILTGNNGVNPSNRDISPDDEGLSTGAITGLVAGGLVALLMVAILLVRSNNHYQGYYSKQHEEELEEIMPAELEGTDDPDLAKSKSARSSHSLKKPSMDNDGHEAYVKVSGGKDDSSSNAGSSGWSSHGGMSSIDTSSVDDELSSAFSATGVGMSLAALGAAAHTSVFRSRSSQSEGDDDDIDMDRSGDITMTYSELDRAISKGDWAAVGKLLRMAQCHFGLCVRIGQPLTAPSYRYHYLKYRRFRRVAGLVGIVRYQIDCVERVIFQDAVTVHN